MPAAEPEEQDNGMPPRRVEYDLGPDGQEQFHEVRAHWYFLRTGKELCGSLAEQNDVYDNAVRNYRVRGGDCV